MPHKHTHRYIWKKKLKICTRLKTNLYSLSSQQQKTVLMRNNSALQNVTLRTRSEEKRFLPLFSVWFLSFILFLHHQTSSTQDYTLLHKYIPFSVNDVFSHFYLQNFLFIAQGVRERPSSAIYPSESFRQTLLGSRRGRSNLILSKSVSTNNIVGWVSKFIARRNFILSLVQASKSNCSWTPNLIMLPNQPV